MRPRELSIDAAPFAARFAATVLVLACALAMVTPRAARAEEPDAPPAAAPAAKAAAPGATPAENDGGGAAAVAPMPPEAQALYDRGLELFRTRDFLGAARLLEQGFVVEPRREFLFAEAQALRLAGQCARAVALYQRFIDSGAPPVQAQAARLGIDRCAPERASVPPTAPTPAGPRAADGATTGAPAPGPASESPRWWRDPWVIASAGVGVAALAVGTAAFVASNQRVAEARSPRTTTEPMFDRLWDQATTRRELSLVSLALGAGVLAAGGARALWLHHHHHQTAPGGASAVVPSFVPARGGGTLSWELAF